MEPRSPSETQGLAQDHLLYEIQMVAGLVWRLARHHTLFLTSALDLTPLRMELLDLAGRNADIEALGLHARVLVDFFYGERECKADAIAADFFDHPMVWKRARRKLPQACKGACGYRNGAPVVPTPRSFQSLGL